MPEFLFIFVFLLPVAWYFGYRQGLSSDKKDAPKSSQGLSKVYFTGLNYLLNEQPDKAIDSFVSLLEVDSETVETHLALGNLFRRRGEVDRAIRLHQNLIARPSLSDLHKKQALMELGLDYMVAGLLDRAEAIFSDLIKDSRHQDESLKQLLDIYQQTKDWENAIEISKQLSRQGKTNLANQIGHFYCELAEHDLSQSQTKSAISHVKKALDIESSHIRASLLMGNIHHQLGQYRRAIKRYRDLVSYNVELLPEVIDKVSDCFQQLKNHQGFIKFLNEAIQRGAGISVILTLAEEIQKDSGDIDAAKYIASQMEQHPSVKGLLKLIELHLKHASENAKPSLIMLQNVVLKLLENKPVYHCHHCGFDSKSLFWQCPSCKVWGSVKPIQGVEGE
jgi:lipopolysaccharide biosynthesis regulator YciM